jgi:hypothetical protein
MSVIFLWFTPDALVPSNKTDCHDITEIALTKNKVSIKKLGEKE